MQCSQSAKPKPATGPKATKAAAARAARGGKKPTAKGTGRRPPKTAEQLDADMADYFGPTNGAEGASTAQPANGDHNMDDEVLVGSSTRKQHKTYDV